MSQNNLSDFDNFDNLKKYFEQNGIEEVSPESDWETSSEQSEVPQIEYDAEENQLCAPSSKRRALEKDGTH